jgi:hypothetical protein
MAKAEPCITTSIRLKTHNDLMKYRGSLKAPPSQVDLISLAVEEYLDRKYLDEIKSDLLKTMEPPVKNEDS